jgi:hypothetical protein
MNERRKHVGVPGVTFFWKILDGENRTVWSTTSQGRFAYRESRYFQGDSGAGENYDFRRVSMREAIVGEILESGDGLSLPAEMPTEMIRGDGRYVEFPQSWHWKAATPGKVQ